MKDTMTDLKKDTNGKTIESVEAKKEKWIYNHPMNRQKEAYTISKLASNNILDLIEPFGDGYRSIKKLTDQEWDQLLPILNRHGFFYAGFVKGRAIFKRGGF